MAFKCKVLEVASEYLPNGIMVTFKIEGHTHLCTTRTLYKLQYYGYEEEAFSYIISSSEKVSCPCGKRFLCPLGEGE